MARLPRSHRCSVSAAGAARCWDVADFVVGLAGEADQINSVALALGSTLESADGGDRPPPQGLADTAGLQRGARRRHSSPSQRLGAGGASELRGCSTRRWARLRSALGCAAAARGTLPHDGPPSARPRRAGSATGTGRASRFRPRARSSRAERTGALPAKGGGTYPRKCPRLPVPARASPVSNARRPTPNAQRSTHGARRLALGARRPTLNAQRSTLNAQRSTLNAQRPTLNAQRSTLVALGGGGRTLGGHAGREPCQASCRQRRALRLGRSALRACGGGTPCC
jgi:hypothetical protein